MRIIAGSLGGRIFASPHSHVTHPMSDRVRGALFNTLGDISGLTVLDAFAGSGALIFEALSRGASYAVAIDNDKSAQRTIAENIHTLGLGGQAKLIRSTANGWLTTSPDTEFFDIVLCDPPYQDLQMPLITRLAEKMAEKGILVLSWPGNARPPEFSGLELALAKDYGDAQLFFYKHA